MIVIDIFNWIQSLSPEYFLAATIFARMGSGTQSGKLLFKGLCSGSNISMTEYSDSIKICDTTPKPPIEIETNRVVRGDSISGITGSIFYACCAWNSISADSNLHKGLIISEQQPQSVCLYNYSGLIIGGHFNKNYSSCGVILGGKYNYTCGSANSSIIASNCSKTYSGGVLISTHKSKIEDSKEVGNSVVSSTCAYINCSDQSTVLGSSMVYTGKVGSSTVISSGSSKYETKLYRQELSSIISGRIVRFCQLDTGYSKQNSSISTTCGYIGCNSCYNSMISTRCSCIYNTVRNSAIIGGTYQKISSYCPVDPAKPTNNSSILAGVCNCVYFSNQSSIIGSCNAKISCSSGSTIISHTEVTSSGACIGSSKYSSIIGGKGGSHIVNSNFSTIISSCYGCIKNSKYSLLHTTTANCVGDCVDIKYSTGSILIQDQGESYIYSSDSSVLITRDCKNYIRYANTSAIISSRGNCICSTCDVVSGNFILGSRGASIVGNINTCGNFINSVGTICYSSNSSALSSGVGNVCCSKNSSVIGSCVSTIISSTNSVIIGTCGATISNSTNSAIIGTKKNKFLCNTSNTTRVGHLNITGSASIFVDPNACFGIDCIFSGASIASISVCHGFIIALS